MEQTLHIVRDQKRIASKTGAQLVAGGTATATEQADRAVKENSRRAEEIGPVLEEMLDNQWKHWGLNN
jgi:hypothetical protein